jgi:hypothetical protein
MRGVWNGSESSEKIEQDGITRHKLLIVNCGTDTTVAWNPCDSSGIASADPNNIASALHNDVTDKGPEGGPHFVMSAETSDNSHPYGFEFCLFLDGIPGAQQADSGVGGWSVTVWALISATQTFGSSTPPLWASFATLTGVSAREMYHSFDCNASALRFQIGNLETDPGTANLSIGIAFAEL